MKCWWCSNYSCIDTGINLHISGCSTHQCSSTSYHQPNDKKWICNFSFVFHSPSVGQSSQIQKYFHSSQSQLIQMSHLSSPSTRFHSLAQCVGDREQRGTVNRSQIPLPIQSQIYEAMRAMVVIQIMFISYHFHFNLSLNYISFALTSPSAHIIIM